MNELREVIQHAPLLAKLSSEQLDDVAMHAVRLKLSVGETLFEAGDRADRFFLVVHGQIKLSRLSPDGNEKVIEIIVGGHTFAEALMFQEKPHYPVSASALVDAELISFDSASFARMLRGSVDTCFLLLADLSQRLRGLIKEIDDISLQSGACRVAAFLLTRAPGDTLSFRLDIPKGIIASRLSLKPETLSRIIRRMQDDNILSVSRDMITIMDKPALQDIAEVCDSGTSASGITELNNPTGRDTRK